MQKFEFEYKHKVTGGSGVIEAKTEAAAKKQITDYIKNDPLSKEHDIKLKDVEISIKKVEEN